MDKSLFISMGGASNASRQLQIITNNLANINTTAFRSDASYIEQHKVTNEGDQSRVYAKLNKSYTEHKVGSIFNTDRDLDFAVDGNGFIAVQSKSGQEAYTRAGNLQIKDHILMTQSGNLVLGNGGAITIPDAQRIQISPDGTISALFVGNKEMVPIDKIKLTNPSVNDLTKGEDALFYFNGNGTAPVDNKIRLIPGSLEGSNVSAIETMTQLIDLTRHYQIHTNFMKTVMEDTAKENQLLEVPR